MINRCRYTCMYVVEYWLIFIDLNVFRLVLFDLSTVLLLTGRVIMSMICIWV